MLKVKLFNNLIKKYKVLKILVLTRLQIKYIKTAFKLKFFEQTTFLISIFRQHSTKDNKLFTLKMVGLCLQLFQNKNYNLKHRLSKLKVLFLIK